MAASEYAVLKCHSASLMEWENVEVSGQLGDGRSRACVVTTVIRMIFYFVRYNLLERMLLAPYYQFQ